MCAIGGVSHRFIHSVPVPESALFTLSGWSSTVRTSMHEWRFAAPLLPDGLEEGAGPQS
jgi:hypothetical protein